MKKIILPPLVCFTIGIYFLFAYDYQTVYSSHPAFFHIGTNGDIVTSEIDSVFVTGNDSVFYPARNIQQKDDPFCKVLSPSWLGDKVEIKEGVNIFLNLENKKITIKTDALQDETWEVYKGEDGLRVEGTVIKHEQEEFLGIVDMVKTISFRYYDKDNNPMEVEVPTIKISEKHGFVTALNFLCFPYVPENIHYLYFKPYNSFSTLELVGLTAPEAGIRNLTWKEVHDFQPGDELHVVEEQWETYGKDEESYKSGFIYQSIHRYLSRTDNEDKIMYTVERTSQKSFLKNNEITYYKDTIEETIKANPEFDLLPAKIYVPDIDPAGLTFRLSPYMQMQYTLTKMIMDRYRNGFSLYYDDPVEEYAECLSGLPILTEFCSIIEEIYRKGLGGPYYACPVKEGQEAYHKDLVYYKKGDTTWGTPLELTNSVQKIQNNASFAVYPNPVKDILHIDGIAPEQVLLLEIRDISGKVLIRKNIDYTDHSVSFAAILPGVYFYSIIDNNRRIYSNKIIKQ